ncbi:MAG: leucine-rich repeat domain-containing protein [Firmicutes bacterium]|nr:leucine-rich repeat domain-containing protein [Bacillota bacterium]
MSTITKKCSVLLLALAMMICFLPALGQDAYAEEDETPIVGVENILSGLSGGKIVVGRDVTFNYSDLMALNADLRAVVAGDEEAVIGIRKSTGEEYDLTPGEGGVYRFSALEDERLSNVWYKVTVTVPSTGKVYVANMPVYVSSFRIKTLTIQTEGQGTINVEGLTQVAENQYEYSDGDTVDITFLPAEGWYYDTRQTQGGSLILVSKTEHTYAPSGGDIILKAIFKEIVTTGSCGANATYAFDTRNGTLTISGTGVIAKDAFNNDGISDWDAVKSVVIGDGITEIGENAFIFCRNMTSASLPAGITKIGVRSFNNCRKLTSINIPSEVTIIGEGAFSNCAFSEIELPDGLTYIGVGAFQYNDALREITVPESVTFLGYSQFNGCTNLETAVIKADITTLPRASFDNCNSLEMVTLSDSITTIDGYAFAYTNSLETVDLPDGLTKLEDCVFYQSRGVKSIKIPDGVTEIPSYTFWKCTSLENVDLPEGLTAIDACAFQYCSGLTSVVLPDGLQSLDSSAFASCSRLSEINLPSGITKIPSQCFLGDSLLTSIDLPDGLTEIEYSAFSNTGLTSIDLPDGLTKIGDSAFYNNTSLTGTLTIPLAITEIRSSAFYGSNFTTIVNNSAKTFTVRELLGSSSFPSETMPIFLDSEGEETDTIGQGTYTRKAVETPVDQTITASNVTKTYGNAPFSLGVKTDGDGTLSYTSDNAKVAVVDSAGKVTIKGAGTAQITIRASATEKCNAAVRTITVTVSRAANPLAVKAKKATVKYSKVKKKAQTLAVSKVISFTKKGQGTVTYTKTSGNKKITISKTTGKLTLKKGLKKGTYKVKVKVTASGNSNYNASAGKTVTVTIKVK